jgi:hypothetical protein
MPTTPGLVNSAGARPRSYRAVSSQSSARATAAATPAPATPAAPQNFNPSFATSLSAPPEYHLNIVDSRRFMALLDEGKERLDLIGMMLADSSKRRESAKGTGASAGNNHHTDIADLLANQSQLEQRFSQLMQKRKELRGLANRNRANENELEIQEVIALLRQSANNVTVHLKDVPSLSGAFQKLARDRDMVASALEQSLQELQHGSYYQLVEFINSHIEQHRLLEESQKTLAINLEKSHKLEIDIKLEEASFKQSEEEKNREIAKLTQHLKHLKKVTANQLRYEEDAARAELESIRRVREYRLQELEGEIERLQRDVSMDGLAHEKATAFLDMQRRELDTLHQTWEQKLAADVAKRDSLFSNLSELREREKAKLNALAERWEVEEDERLEQLEEIKRRTIEKQQQEELAERMDRAQRLIRFWWRVYKRKLAKKSKKKKKKTTKKDDKASPGSRMSASRG